MRASGIRQALTEIIQVAARLNISSKGERTAIGVTKATGTITAYAPRQALQNAWALALATILLLAALPLISAPALAQSGDRTLYLHYTHTGETARITFRRNGRYDQAGLNQLNQFLRDWRRNEPTRMDPALFDLIWTVYQEVNATQPVTVVSAYRAPETNEMLRARSSGVAENSRHTMGMAMDFYIPGVQLSKLREVAMRHQVGGVGYYPNSGSPFVHLDTGNVRAWPRMTRAQLQRLFPDGRTLHLPAEGNTPLSEEGRRYAMAEWQRCKSVPCAGGNTPNTAVGGGGNGRNLLDMIFGGDGDEVDTIQVASNAPAAQAPAPSAIPLTPPVPAARASFLDYRNPEIVVPVAMPETLLVASRSTSVGTAADAAEGLGTFDPALDGFTVASIGETDQPTPRELLNRDMPVIAAYAPTLAPEPDAQRALQMLIERRNLTEAAPAPELRGSIQTASLGQAPQISLEDAANFFASTWSAVQAATSGAAEPVADQLAGSPAYELFDTPARTIEFTAPDLNVGQAMLISANMADVPVDMSTLPSAGDFSPATQLGVHCKSMQFNDAPDLVPANQFAAQRPLFVASL